MSLQVQSTDGTATIDRVSVTTAATQLASADPSRKELLVVNNGTAVIDVGPATVSSGAGIPVQPNGGSLRLTASTGAKGAWYGVVASGTADVASVKAQ